MSKYLYNPLVAWIEADSDRKQLANVCSNDRSSGRVTLVGNAKTTSCGISKDREVSK